MSFGRPTFLVSGRIKGDNGDCVVNVVVNAVLNAVGEQDGDAERVEILEHGVEVTTEGDTVGKISAKSAASAKIESEHVGRTIGKRLTDEAENVDDVDEHVGNSDRVELDDATDEDFMFFKTPCSFVYITLMSVIRSLFKPIKMLASYEGINSIS